MALCWNKIIELKNVWSLQDSSSCSYKFSFASTGYVRQWCDLNRPPPKKTQNPPQNIIDNYDITCLKRTCILTSQILRCSLEDEGKSGRGLDKLLRLAHWQRRIEISVADRISEMCKLHVYVENWSSELSCAIMANAYLPLESCTGCFWQCMKEMRWLFFFF